ncbi:hypothetical protein [Lysobacter sp. BMK333-48F3]|uniref:hypothetical protein n=1 Tax=Lysobacter sp. BMK333-48F3 TaxID=2867962 RepID=UPI0021036871|nr:hypothetical protein [Lysobacter sp. BMK333-48F3]
MAMIVPQYWAEAQVQERFGRDHPSGRRSLTVRRFGWSDASLAEAQAMADARARDAFDRLLAGQSGLARSEPRVPYDAEGLPIREQIVERDGDSVVTRNSYGARCLNTPEVLFADIDYDAPVSAWRRGYLFASLAIGVAVGWFSHPGFGFLAFFASVFGFSLIARAQSKRRHAADGGPEIRAMQRVRAFLAGHPDWHLRLYRTPAGLRLLAMHRTFDPNEPAVAEFFAAVGADPQFALMCQRQHCFRARLSPKPWRIGIRERLRPRPGVWPIDPAYLAEREQWVAEYERKAVGYAACRFVESLGSRDYVTAAQHVQRLHDEACRAQSALPLA